MRVLLHDPSICERGTTRAIAEYALMLQGRGHEVQLLYSRHSPTNHVGTIRMLEQQFPVRSYGSVEEMGRAARGVDVTYAIKSGRRDGATFPGTLQIVHAVFPDFDPHGDKYLYVSNWLASAMRKRASGLEGLLTGQRRVARSAQIRGCRNALEFESLPHAVNMPEPGSQLRGELGIPQDAFVMFRHGGMDTFDIPWVHEAIEQTLEASPCAHFVGLNTAPFTSHERALFLPSTADRQLIADLLCSSNLFLHARLLGESFGIAIVEALQAGLPVLAWEGGRDRNHVAMLKDLDGLYRGVGDLRNRLRIAIETGPVPNESWKQRGDSFRPAALETSVFRAFEDWRS